MNLLKTFKRGWKIYVSPPKETRIFFRPSKSQLNLTTIVGTAQTAVQPKQVSVDIERKLAYVTGMSSQLLQEFSFAEDNLVLTRQWEFPEQCVEVEYSDGRCYLTTTNFRRGTEESSHLRILGTSGKGEVLSSVNTGGEWSKVIKLDTSQRVAYVSNWHSNSLSIIDVGDHKNPKVVDVLPCPEAPRGIAVRQDGLIIATSFYGRRIFQVANINGKYQIVKQSPRFEPTAYGGNMRDVLLTRDGRTAWVSNLGRNLLHWYDAETLELCGSINVSRKPNSIKFLDSEERLIAVSCRQDNLICFIDTTQKCVVGVSTRTGEAPTGLSPIDNGLLVTTFANNTLELHRLKS